MVPVIWLQSLETDIDTITQRLSSLGENRTLLSAVCDCYRVNAAKYMRTLIAYNRVLDSISKACGAAYQTISDAQILSQTLDAVKSTAIIKVDMFSKSEHELWLGFSFYDPDLITAEVIGVMTDVFSLDAGKESMFRGLTISNIVKTQRSAVSTVTVQLDVCFTEQELNSINFVEDEDYHSELFSSIVLLLGFRNRELCGIIQPQTIKEKLNAIREATVQ